MAHWDLTSSAVLRVQRFETFEQFHPSGVLGAAKTVAIDHGTLPVLRAELALPDSRLVMQRTFARVYEGELGAESCGLVVPMSNDHYHTVNGQAVKGDGIVLLRGFFPCRVHEPHPNTHTLIRLNTSMHMRGWADFERGFAHFRVNAPQMRHIQHLIASFVRRASTCSDVNDFALRATAMQEALYSALDDILIQQETLKSRPRSYDRHLRIVGNIDEIIQQSPAAAIYSEDLAHTIGSSVRTVQTAVMAVHGIPLHKYIRMKKLWMVRRILTSGYPGLNIKAAALAHGFWHMGEFSQSYKANFGELPSDTLGRARWPA